MKGKGQDTPITVAVEYMCNLTSREKACVEYLLKMGEAEAQAIGDYISRVVPNCRPNTYALGASTCGRLRAVGIVVHLGDTECYRLSDAALMMLGRFRAKANGVMNRSTIPHSNAALRRPLMGNNRHRNSGHLSGHLG